MAAIVGIYAVSWCRPGIIIVLEKIKAKLAEGGPQWVGINSKNIVLHDIVDKLVPTKDVFEPNRPTI